MDLLLHEDLGGGFSPPAAHKVRRLGRKSREHGVDRTPYKGDRKISFVSYHTRAISMNIVRATAWTRCTTPRKKLRASSAANAPAAPPRSADLLQLSVAPESESAAHARVRSTVHGVLGLNPSLLSKIRSTPCVVRVVSGKPCDASADVKALVAVHASSNSFKGL